MAILSPFSSKFFLRAASVGRIEMSITAICSAIVIKHIDSKAMPLLRSITKSAAVTGSSAIPQKNHVLPKCLCANSQVSLLFMDFLVR